MLPFLERMFIRNPFEDSQTIFKAAVKSVDPRVRTFPCELLSLFLYLRSTVCMIRFLFRVMVSRSLLGHVYTFFVA